MENKNTKNTEKNTTSLINFNRRFPNEASCKRAFVDYRIKAGIKCPHCGCEAHYWLPSINRFQCKNCGCRQTLRANTVMHYSKLPFRYWFIAMWLISNTKNAFSAAEVQRQLGHEYYRPIWNMMLKIRKAMGADIDKLQLSGEVEIDEALITTKIRKDITTSTYKGKPYKHKRPYAHTKTKCVVMCESKVIENHNKKKYALNRACGNLRIIAVEDFKANTLNNVVENRINTDSTVYSDGTLSHKDFPSIFKSYIAKVIPTEELSKTLPYVHIAIGNLKAQLRNVHHSVAHDYLQFYLDVFCWKFNHRNSPNIFNDIMMVATSGR